MLKHRRKSLSNEDQCSYEPNFLYFKALVQGYNLKKKFRKKWVFEYTKTDRENFWSAIFVQNNSKVIKLILTVTSSKHHEKPCKQ